MTVVIYSIDDCTNKISISNFEYFISYGIRNYKWVSSKYPITQIIIFVKNKSQFYNTFNLDNISIELTVLETNLVNSLDIIKQFYTYVNKSNPVWGYTITNVFYVNSNLIGPVLDSREVSSHWIDILFDKSNNETPSVKHFSRNMLIFNFYHYQNKVHELKKAINVDLYIFRKNTMPLNFDYRLYKTYLNECCLIKSYNKPEYLIYHYLKYNKRDYDEIEYLVKNKIGKTIEPKYETIIPNKMDISILPLNSSNDVINEIDKIPQINELDNMPINITSKETFREACLQQLPLVQNIEIPEIQLNCSNETVLIEFRWFDHLEFLLRNTLLKLPNWSHTVICGNNNYETMKQCCDQISVSIRLIKLDINNLIPSEYNVLLMTAEFWSQFHGEKLLIYQEDSFLFHSNKMMTFLEYDYVGAPWKDKQDDNSYGVGNGGFSLRSKSIMLEVIDKIKLESLIIGESTKEYMKNANVYILPEDVYFTKSMIDYNIGKVAPRDVALRFSQESVCGINPVGGHNFFLANNKLDIYYTMLKLTNGNDYYKTVTHRGGWKSVINYGLQSQVLTNSNVYNGYYLIDCCEKYFLWDNLTMNQPWIGIIHITPYPPKYMDKILHINSLFSCDNFKKSLPLCNGLIVLSKYQLDWIQHFITYKLPRIIMLYHPTEILSKLFDLNQFTSTTDSFNIVLLGQQLRRITDLLDIESPIINKKIWLSGIINEHKRIDFLQSLITGLEMNPMTLIDFKNNIDTPYLTNYAEYDDLIQSSILVMPLFDAAANNSILECIISNTPIFVTRCYGTVEYLGSEYPMFFNDINELNILLSDKQTVFELYKITHEYLTKMDKTHLSYKHFYSEILKFINNI